MVAVIDDYERGLLQMSLGDLKLPRKELADVHRCGADELGPGVRSGWRQTICAPGSRSSPLDVPALARALCFPWW
jgi:hypothetical protein